MVEKNTLIARERRKDERGEGAGGGEGEHINVALKKREKRRIFGVTREKKMGKTEWCLQKLLDNEFEND